MCVFWPDKETFTTNIVFHFNDLALCYSYDIFSKSDLGLSIKNLHCILQRHPVIDYSFLDSERSEFTMMFFFL